MGAQKMVQKVTSNTGNVGGNPQQQGQCVQVSQAMIGSQPTAQIISPLQVTALFQLYLSYQVSFVIVVWYADITRETLAICLLV